jgi:cytoskeletal protein CcmA (bactofilin family)
MNSGFLLHIHQNLTIKIQEEEKKMPPKGDNLNSIIGEGSIFQGNFTINGSIEVDGKFEGDLKSESQVIIGETGKVKTSVIVANKIIVAGTLIGNIRAKEEVTLLETGRILGDIETPILNVQKGVVIQGQIKITGGQSKQIEDLVKESYQNGPDMPQVAGKKETE